MLRLFTLVELMIVVGIISVLAAIAVPNFVEMQLRSKYAEIPVNLDGINVALVAYNADQDTYTDSGGYNPPTATLGKQPRAWLTGTGFDDLGWAPDGDVRGSYWAESHPNCPLPDVWGARAASDIDGDGSGQVMVCCIGGRPSSPFINNQKGTCGQGFAADVY